MRVSSRAPAQNPEGGNDCHLAAHDTPGRTRPLNVPLLGEVPQALRQNDKSIFMWVFDLIELDSDGLRLDPLEVRKSTLATVVAMADPGLLCVA
jgi:hypothetical protein